MNGEHFELGDRMALEWVWNLFAGQRHACTVLWTESQGANATCGCDLGCAGDDVQITHPTHVVNRIGMMIRANNQCAFLGADCSRSLENPAN